MGISLKQLESAIKQSWGRYTCHYKFLWDDKELPDSAGHCRVVSLIVQDYFGGEIMHTNVKGNSRWDHYYNKLPSGKIIDITADQFPKNTKFAKPKIISRKVALCSVRSQRGYQLLKNRVKEILHRK